MTPSLLPFGALTTRKLLPLAAMPLPLLRIQPMPGVVPIGPMPPGIVPYPYAKGPLPKSGTSKPLFVITMLPAFALAATKADMNKPKVASDFRIFRRRSLPQNTCECNS